MHCFQNSLREEVLRFAKEIYDVNPEYLWKRFPNYAVLRHEENRKWFGIIMDVPRKTLGLGRMDRVDILNVKINPIFREDLRREAGILPAYHMNRATWISVLLDGTVLREHVEKLLAMSYAQTLRKPAKVK